MADLNELSAADRADLESRLANFGVDSSALLANDLSTTPSAITTLANRRDTSSRFQPVVLRTTDFDRVNQWIGVPDDVFQATTPIVDMPVKRRDGVLARAGKSRALPGAATRIAGLSSAASPSRADLVASLTSEDLSEVRSAARAYLRGNSKALIEYKDVIQAVFPVIEIPLWPFLNVTVKSGSVLEFGPGPHALVAHSITIEDGGIIRSYGDLTVSATILRREAIFHPFHLDPAILGTRVFGKSIFEP